MAPAAAPAPAPGGDKGDGADKGGKPTLVRQLTTAAEETRATLTKKLTSAVEETRAALERNNTVSRYIRVSEEGCIVELIWLSKVPSDLLAVDNGSPRASRQGLRACLPACLDLPRTID